MTSTVTTTIAMTNTAIPRAGRKRPRTNEPTVMAAVTASQTTVRTRHPAVRTAPTVTEPATAPTVRPRSREVSPVPSSTRWARPLRLVAAENPRKPLSDNKLASLLNDQGIKVARRTVAKYREAMRIPSSSARKRLV